MGAIGMHRRNGSQLIKQGKKLRWRFGGQEHFVKGRARVYDGAQC
jgi:hypothetical protein